MYNHYIPQSDGSYRRSTVPDQNRRTSPQNNPPRSQQPQKQPSSPPPRQDHSSAPPPPQQCPSPQCEGESILSFLRNLLPKQIDATDLLVILLILLMNKDDDPQGLSPLLTLALYFLL